MSYLWKSKAQPQICGKHRPRTNWQEESCSSHQTQAQRFLWPWACKLCKHFFTQNLVVCDWKKTFYPKQVSLKPLVPFSCKMEAEGSFIILWHPKWWFSTWSFLNIFSTCQFAVSQNVSQYIASNSKCKLLKCRQLSVLERQTVFIF